jgi:PAS domain S-box-containing protein
MTEERTVAHELHLWPAEIPMLFARWMALAVPLGTVMGATERTVPDDSGKTREALLDELVACRQRIAELERGLDPVGERLLTGLLHAAPDGVLIADAAGVLRLVNHTAEQMLGYERGELVGKPIEVLVPLASVARHAGLREGYAREPRTRRMGTGLTLSARKKDGTELPVEISLSPLETPDGRFVVSSVRDVTERRESEQLQRRQAEALERSNDQLQQFAYVASHDLQEPLRMVSSYLQLLERRYNDRLDDDAREFIGFAVDGAKRMQALINDLLVYSRIGQREEVHGRVDLNDIVARELKSLEVAIREADAVVEVARLPVVTAEGGQMGQLFLNLIGNALKFRRPGVRPTIGITAERGADSWTITVSDNGIGMDPQYRERIFQIFQRLHTRSEYPGTGIGLAICKRIVDGHGGTIAVETAQGAGSKFKITLPDRRRTP